MCCRSGEVGRSGLVGTVGLSGNFWEFGFMRSRGDNRIILREHRTANMRICACG